MKMLDAGGIPDLCSYAALSREDEVAAREDAAIIKTHTRSAAESIIEVGLALKRQKERLPHGMFLPWIRTEFGMSERSQQDHERCGRLRRQIRNRYDFDRHSPLRTRRPLTPEPVRQAVGAHAAADETVTAAEIKWLKAEAKTSADRIASLEARNSELAAKAGKPVAVDMEAIRERARVDAEASLRPRINDLADALHSADRVKGFRWTRQSSRRSDPLKTTSGRPAVHPRWSRRCWSP